MTSDSQACPSCETIQRFSLRQRPYQDSAEVIEVYITCKICPFEHVLRISTKRLEVLEHMAEQLRARGDVQQRRHGVRSTGNKRSLEQLNMQIAVEKEKLT
jgi:hypothetical protein